MYLNVAVHFLYTLLGFLQSSQASLKKKKIATRLKNIISYKDLCKLQNKAKHTKK